MSITLTTEVLSIDKLSQPEKHILTILCFRADKNHEAYSTIERLSLDCSCSIKTVERALKKLRDIGFLKYTGKLAPKSKNIPVYKIDISNHGLSGGDRTLTTDSQSFNHGLSGNLTTPSEGIRIDNINKDNRKDILKNACATPIKKYDVLENEYNKEMDFLKNAKLINQIVEFKEWLEKRNRKERVLPVC